MTSSGIDGTRLDNREGLSGTHHMERSTNAFCLEL